MGIFNVQRCKYLLTFSFNVPQGVAVDKTGKYIVVDSGNNCILAFNV
jgi:hypothetical protein